MPDYMILLIDYDPRSIERATALLAGAGYTVEVAKNGIDGLAAFKRLRPALVLVEAMLPKKHGFEVCQEIKQSVAGATVPVVIFTSVYKGRKYRSQAFHLYKCDEYLEKPVPDERLLEVVRGLLPKAQVADTPVPRPVQPPETGFDATPKAPEAAAAPVEPELVAAAAPASTGSRPNRPRHDGPIAQFTEDDIMSTLDALMPDEPARGPSAPRKTASN